MFDAERFRSRLAAKSMSQSKMARLVGVSQQSVARLASGDAYGTKHLHKIARELGTTPAYLMGETDDPDSDAPEEPQFTPDQRELIAGFESLDRTQQQAVMTIVASMAGRARDGVLLHSAKPGFHAQGMQDR